MSTFLLLFDVMSIFLVKEATGRFFNSPLWLNDFIIVIVRVIAYLAWAAPIFYLFWPQIVGRNIGGSRGMESDNLNKRTVAGHTLPSGILS
jgi:hypothetical protein